MILDQPLFPGAPARMDRYPEIRHLDDVAHRVDPERGVHLFTHEDVLILRYVTARPNTFETELDLECRSLIKFRGRPRPSGRGGIAKIRSICALRLDRPLLSA